MRFKDRAWWEELFRFIGGLLCLASKRALYKSRRERLIKAGVLLGVE
jgi:hypothetical protein